MGILVPTVRTSYTKEQMIKGLIEAWYKMYNDFPQKKSIGVIYAQNCLETGGTTSMWNNNYGNVKYVQKDVNDGIKYMQLAGTWEIINKKKVVFQPPHPATWFRAFDSLAEGIAFHLDILKNKNFKSAWIAVEKGDPALFAKLLKDKWYYSASLEDYTKAMNIYYNRYMKDQTFEKCLEELKNPKPIELEPIEITGEIPVPEIINPPVVENKIENKNIWQTLIELLMKAFK